jgi:hypothetical protein
MAQNVIKSIFPNECPHCKKTILIGVQSMSPILSEVMTEESAEEAKKKVIEEAKKILKGEALENTLEWLKDEGTIFGPNDVSSIIENLKN